jgi:AcrR family transcriptional regulator
MANREQAKEQRRRQITAAARTLMQKTGQTGFSMRALADEADVSIATPYNLFGSKQAIMAAVLDDDLQHYQERLAKLRSDELEVFFKAVSLATSLYSLEPAFNKAVLFAVYNEGGRDYRPMFSGPRHVLWRSLVQAAIDAGYLERATDADIFAVNLQHIFFSCILEWVADQLNLAELELRVHYGFALSLLAVATPSSRARLHDKALEAQRRIKEHWKKLAKSGRTAETRILERV